MHLEARMKGLPVLFKPVELYIADYVIDEGTESESMMPQMIDSDDGIAEELFAAYPESIDVVAKKYAYILPMRSTGDAL